MITRIPEGLSQESNIVAAKVFEEGACNTIPNRYGAYEPTAIKVPMKHFRGKKKKELITTELFGPFQIVVEYGSKDVDFLLEILEDLPHHLTAACVSNDHLFTE